MGRLVVANLLVFAVLASAAALAYYGWSYTAEVSSRERAIICDTKMAKGVPFLETREKSHFMRVEQHEWSKALDALEAGRKA